MLQNFKIYVKKQENLLQKIANNYKFMLVAPTCHLNSLW